MQQRRVRLLPPHTPSIHVALRAVPCHADPPPHIRFFHLLSGYLPQAKKGQPLIVRPCKEYESNACGCLRLATVCIAYALLPCTVSCSVSDSCAWSCALAWYVWQRGERHCTPYVASKIMRRRPPSGRGCRLCASMSGRQDVLHRVLSVGLTARRKHVDSSDDDDAIDVDELCYNVVHRGIFSDWRSVGAVRVVPLRGVKRKGRVVCVIYVRERCPHCGQETLVRMGSNYDKHRRAAIRAHLHVCGRWLGRVALPRAWPVAKPMERKTMAQTVMDAWLACGGDGCGDCGGEGRRCMRGHRGTKPLR